MKRTQAFFFSYYAEETFVENSRKRNWFSPRELAKSALWVVGSQIVVPTSFTG